MLHTGWAWGLGSYFPPTSRIIFLWDLSSRGCHLVVLRGCSQLSAPGALVLGLELASHRCSVYSLRQRSSKRLALTQCVRDKPETLFFCLGCCICALRSYIWVWGLSEDWPPHGCDSTGN